MFSFLGALRPGDTSRPARAGLLSICVSQLSFFSAESVPPAVADLTGLLAAPGQVVLVGRAKPGARLSVVVDRPWRAEALAEMIVEAGLQPEIARTDENTPLVRTAVDPRLVGIAARLDPWRGQDGAAAVAARTAGAAGLDAGGGHPRGGPLSARPGPARPGHAFAACLGADAGGDSPDVDRHQGAASGAADQWPHDGYRAW